MSISIKNLNENKIFQNIKLHVEKVSEKERERERKFAVTVEMGKRVGKHNLNLMLHVYCLLYWKLLNAKIICQRVTISMAKVNQNLMVLLVAGGFQFQFCF